jgi:hypothetical protein
MAEESEAVDRQPEAWNYFNYFTEVEEHFQRARGTGLFLLSSVDWVLVESWKNAGLPLEAVLRGVDVAFEKYHARKRKDRMVNSISYCTQEIHKEAEAMAKGAPVRHTRAEPPFDVNELRAFLQGNAALLAGNAQFRGMAAALEDLAREVDTHYTDLEQLEQRLTALEDKMAAIVRASVPDEELFELRRELDAAMRPYRARMTAAQLDMLERQYLDRRIQEKAGLPRLSLFYLK